MTAGGWTAAAAGRWGLWRHRQLCADQPHRPWPVGRGWLCLRCSHYERAPRDPVLAAWGVPEPAEPAAHEVMRDAVPEAVWDAAVEGMGGEAIPVGVQGVLAAPEAADADTLYRGLA